jgi:phage-related tail fiber protein
MTDLTESPTWEEGIYQIELTDPVVGGADGLSNRQGKQLANRTRWLKIAVEERATPADISAAIAALVASSPAALDTLKELATALGNDPNFATTITNALAAKAPLASPALTGTPTAPTAAAGTSTTQLATTAFVAAVQTLLNTAIAAKAPLASPALTGVPTAPTAATGNNSTQVANTAFVQTAIAALVAAAPAALDTLNELAAALGNDPNFATAMTNAVAARAPLASPALTGSPTAPTPSPGNSSTLLATTAFVQAAVAAAGYPGQVGMFARSTPPAGWLKANGGAVSRSTYAGLFAAIGTTFGAGDGSTTFNLPDLRGEFLRGWDDARGIDSGRAFGSWQDSDNKSHGHGTATTSSDSHAHTFSATTSTAGAHAHTLNGNLTSTGTGSNSFQGRDAIAYTGTTSTDGAHTHTVSGTTSSDAHTHTVTVAAAGGAEARSRNIALLACIKY